MFLKLLKYKKKIAQRTQFKNVSLQINLLPDNLELLNKVMVSKIMIKVIEQTIIMLPLLEHLLKYQQLKIIPSEITLHL